MAENKTHTIQLEVLTPTHIGSGNRIIKDTELYVEQSHTYLIDIEKLFYKMGGDAVAASSLANAANKKEGLTEIIKNRKFNPLDVSKKVFKVNMGSREYSEQMKTGLGANYIPGSSIKGAIRTALFKDALNTKSLKLTGDSKSDFYKIFNVKNINGLDHRSKEINDKKLTDLIFSGVNLTDDAPKNAINLNAMRFLQIGDAEFAHDSTHLYKVNLYAKYSKMWDDAQPLNMAAECLKTGSKATFQIRTANALLDLKSKHQNELKMLTPELVDIHNIFFKANSYMRDLLYQEINTSENENLEEPDEVRAFFDEMNNLYENVSEYNENTCLIRIGYGSGHRFMTGGWLQEQKTSIETEIIERISRKDSSSKFKEHRLSKSRRVTGTERPFGFCKLTILK